MGRSVPRPPGGACCTGSQAAQKMPRPPPRVNPTKHCCAHVSFLRRTDPPRLIAQALRRMPAHTRMLQKPVRMDRNIGATRCRAVGPARFRSRIRLVLGWIASGHVVRHTSGPPSSHPTQATQHKPPNTHAANPPICQNPPETASSPHRATTDSMPQSPTCRPHPMILMMMMLISKSQGTRPEPNI